MAKPTTTSSEPAEQSAVEGQVQGQTQEQEGGTDSSEEAELEKARKAHKEGLYEGDPNTYPDPDNPTRSL